MQSVTSVTPPMSQMKLKIQQKSLRVRYTQCIDRFPLTGVLGWVAQTHCQQEVTCEDYQFVCITVIF